MKKIYSIRAKKRIEKIERIKEGNKESLLIGYGNKKEIIKELKHKDNTNVVFRKNKKLKKVIKKYDINNNT